MQFARSTCLGDVLTTAVCSDKRCSKSSLARVGCSRNVMLAERSAERPLCFFSFSFFFSFGKHALIDLLVWHAKDFRKKPFSEIRSLAKAVELCDRSPCPCAPSALFRPRCVMAITVAENTSRNHGLTKKLLVWHE